MNFVTDVAIPALGLTALVLCIAVLATPRRTRSHLRLAAGALAGCGAGLAGGALLFLWLYGGRLPDTGAVLFLARRAAMAALFWVPVLALWWLVSAQRVERLRGEDVMRAGRGPDD